MVSPGGGGGTGGDGEGTNCLRSPPLPGELLQVSRESSCSRGRRLEGSGVQPQARQIEVGVSELGIEQGGSGCPETRKDLLGGGAIGPAIRVRDMGPDAAYEEGVGRIQP